MSKPQKPTKPQTVTSDAADARDFAEITVPMLDMGPDVYCMRRVDIDISPRQAKAMRLAFDGLQFVGGKVQLPGLSTERPVSRPTDAIRYMLDRIADVYGLPA